MQVYIYYFIYYILFYLLYCWGPHCQTTSSEHVKNIFEHPEHVGLSAWGSPRWSCERIEEHVPSVRIQVHILWPHRGGSQRREPQKNCFWKSKEVSGRAKLHKFPMVSACALAALKTPSKLIFVFGRFYEMFVFIFVGSPWGYGSMVPVGSLFWVFEHVPGLRTCHWRINIMAS